MLKEVRLSNFQGFSDHVLPLSAATVIVGRNNAGKSTIVEALSLISLVTNRYMSLTYRKPPTELGLSDRYLGVQPSLKGLEIELANVCHEYSDPPANIVANFAGGESIRIFIHPKGLFFALLSDQHGAFVRSKSGASRLNLPRVNILPQVGPVSKEENILSPEYVRASMSSRLSSSHFRNQLNLVSESYEKFVQLTEETWPGLRIRSLVRERGLPNDPLSLIVQDGRFSGEIRWMGHGLQVWLQTIWFLSRVPETQPVILDEPDVYLHPDLQRKLIRLLRRRSGQTIVATHSVEILLEVDPEQILVVERLREKSKFATSLAAVQKVTESIGSVHNIHLARLSSAKKFLFIEGDDDLSYLQAFQNVLFQDSQEPFGAVPCKAIGGWNGWNEAIGSSVLIQNESGGRVSPYCILDSDYHTPDEILRRYTEAKGKGIKLHIWRRKEIENYLVSPAVIERVINVQIPKGVRRARTIDVTQRIHEVCRDLRDQVTDAIAEVIFNLDRKAGFASAMRKARASVNSRWDDEPGDGLSIVSGKKVISALSAWSQERYKVTISATRIARSMRRQEISDEIVQVVSAIENLTPMQTAVAEH